MTAFVGPNCYKPSLGSKNAPIPSGRYDLAIKIEQPHSLPRAVRKRPN